MEGYIIMENFTFYEACRQLLTKFDIGGVVEWGKGVGSGIKKRRRQYSKVFEYKKIMQLTYISIQYYRSITDAYKLDLSDLTVLLGKNNMGKTNIIRAINLGMEILKNMSTLHKRKKINKQLYEWHEDFPISLQNVKRIKNKNTSIRMDFTLSDDETSKFQQTTSSLINGILSIYIEIGEDNSIKVTVPKKGKNARSMTSKIVDISQFICERFGIQYIPAVRSEDDAYKSILGLVDDELASIDDDKYQKALEYIEEVQNKCLNNLSDKVKEPLNTFLPEIKHIELYKVYEGRLYGTSLRRSIDIDIDDGVMTSLSNKGDGVKSLITIAMLSQISTQGQRLIIVDEPENHLHPEAIHFIDSVLQKLSENHQVLISTHNPIFVNRNNISSNLIVDAGKVIKASRIEEIRNTLGVICSDNLMDSDYVIVVEGPSDEIVIKKCIEEDEELSKHLLNKSLIVRSIGGTHNIKSEAYSLQQLCCNFMFILDYDSAGKEGANVIKSALSIPEEKIRFFMKTNKKDTELEDYFKPDIYREYLSSKSINIDNPIFKNTSMKWSDRINKICANVGIDFTKGMEAEIKKYISSNLVKTPIRECLTSEGYSSICGILSSIKEDLVRMGKI